MRSRLVIAFPALVLVCLLSGTSLPVPRGALSAQESEHASCCGPITPAGEQLAATLDSMDVESKWLSHEHVNWQTGEPDRGGENEGPGTHTHCSAFAAAAAAKFNVYLLRPPQHGQVLLANAQADWLASEAGSQAGWRKIPDGAEAQRMANQGNFVLVLYQNPDRHVPGHIAVVRPSTKSAKALEENGPEIIQAGEHNHAKTNVRLGFENHAGAWPGGVLYFMHALPSAEASEPRR